MTITIGIPIVCFDRLNLLIEEIKSIEKGTYKDVHIVVIVDGNRNLYNDLKKVLPKFHVRLSIIRNGKGRGWVASINRILKEFESEYYIYGSDDLVFPPDCLEATMTTMKERFPDGFGVVTLGRKHKCIFGLIGRKWIEQFPDRQVFCPFYRHYGADAEHTAFAQRIGKFAFPKNREIQVKHHRINDRTRMFSRSSRYKDLTLWRKRLEEDRIWGVSFER